MKKRIHSIMDMRRKKTGVIVVCAALVLTLATGMAFATEVNRPTATSMEPDEAAYDSRFDRYADFGIVYDKETDVLTYLGESVRFFEDMYPVDEAAGAYAGTTYLNEEGTVDVHGVRDLKNIVPNADGSYDPSGVLVGVAPYTKAEFDARDVQGKTALAVANHDAGPEATASVGVAPTETGVGSNFYLSPEGMTSFQEYAPFGLTYDAERNAFHYHGKLVRRFTDEHGTLAFTREVPDDFDLSVDLTAIRDANGNLTGIIAADQAEFDQRTERLIKDREEWEAFYRDNPWVEEGSMVETRIEYTATDDAEPDSAEYDAPVSETRIVYEASATSTGID